MSDKILWLDLETTGSTEQDEVIEIGLAVTYRDLEVIDTFSQVFLTNMPLSGFTPEVIEMHLANGLLVESSQARVRFKDAGAKVGIVRFLNGHWTWPALAADSRIIPVGGSGISHFDRRFIQRDAPWLARLFKYWSYDVGTLRRIRYDLLKQGKFSPGGRSDQQHRALPDVLKTLEELRHYRDEREDR